VVEHSKKVFKINVAPLLHLAYTTTYHGAPLRCA